METFLEKCIKREKDDGKKKYCRREQKRRKMVIRNDKPYFLKK